MKQQRYRTALAVLAAAMLAVACGRGDRPGGAEDVGRGLARGRAYAQALIVRGRADVVLSTGATVALGYLERLRLGLGSPFRLIDQAMADPRLDDATRERVAWALLARTLEGRAYRVDASALDRVGIAGIGTGVGVGRHHLELIESAIAEARDPRGGELAVRLAYALAAAEHGVARWAPELAARAAALIRDREVARADAERVVDAAGASGRDALELVREWRAERRFEVERPLVTPVPLEAEHEALELAPRLASAIRALAPKLAGGVQASVPRPGSVPLLGRASAVRLAELAEELDAPPQTPIVVAVGMQRRELLSRAPDEATRWARRRFADRSTNEERFAAEYAALVGDDPAAGEVARTALMAAVGMRPYAQERVWFPGFGGPSSRELTDRFGLASVEFDGVPASWRPYYRRMLAESLTDLQRVLPSLDLRGLSVRFGRNGSKASTLAVHDPRRRTIYLPPTTGAGTIAHEVAHDLDWQVALRRFRVRGDYGSDRATRRGDRRLAYSLQRLTTTALMPPTPGDSTPPAHARRPAEVFARSLDWFVVVSLAHDGRMNGQLSSVQDDLLTGYGTVLPPDITGTAGLALVRILDEVAPVYPETREWFLRGYGPYRSLTAYDLVRRVVEADMPEHDAELDGIDRASSGERPLGLAAAGAADQAFTMLEHARDAALATIDAWACQLPAAAHDRRLETARRRLVVRAAAARARGLALHYADELAGDDGRRWLARRLHGAPWPAAHVDERTANLLEDLVERVRRAAQVSIASGAGAFDWEVPTRPCDGMTPLSLR